MLGTGKNPTSSVLSRLMQGDLNTSLATRTMKHHETSDGSVGKPPCELSRYFWELARCTPHVVYMGVSESVGPLQSTIDHLKQLNWEWFGVPSLSETPILLLAMPILTCKLPCVNVAILADESLIDHDLWRCPSWRKNEINPQRRCHTVILTLSSLMWRHARVMWDSYNDLPTHEGTNAHTHFFCG